MLKPIEQGTLILWGLFFALSGCTLLYLFFRNKTIKIQKKIDRLTNQQGVLSDQLRLSQEKNDRLLSILESMSEGVMVIDADQKILLANFVLETNLGFKRGELPGRYFWEALRDLELNEMIKRALIDRVFIRKEHKLLLLDSIFQIQISPVFGGSEFLGVVAVFHDVTKLKELEKMGVEFVANVSHELKTPLTSILGFVETLKNGAIDDRENGLKFLQIIEEQSQKLYRLIEDLLLLSRVEGQKEKPRTESFDFEKMIQRIVECFSPLLAERKIKTHLEISAKPFLIPADPMLMEQAFTNLIDNAIKYNRDSGEIWVRASRTNGAVQLEFSDTGIGIPELDLPRVFERFYRADKSRSRESGGTGLGLSIVKHIVEKHAGRVEVKSAHHKGSTFTLFLPA